MVPMSIVYPVYTVHSIDKIYHTCMVCPAHTVHSMYAAGPPAATLCLLFYPCSHILRSLTPSPATDNGHLKNSEGSLDIAHLRSVALAQVTQVTNALLQCAMPRVHGHRNPDSLQQNKTTLKETKLQLSLMVSAP